MDWQVPLVVAAIAFLALVLWKVRPSFGGGGAPVREALKKARAKIDAAKDDAARAEALCEAGDACASLLGRSGAAAAYYLRAMRCDPRSAAIAPRAAKALWRRPRVLENLLWRRLAHEPWSPEVRDATIAAIHELEHLYRKRIKSPPRAKALHHLAQAIGATPKT